MNKIETEKIEILDKLNRMEWLSRQFKAEITYLGAENSGYENRNYYLHERGVNLFRLLRPMNVIGKPLVRIGHLNDGGYVMVDSGLSNAIAYSCGIEWDVTWDLEMANRDTLIYQYDHTIECLPQEHQNFH